MRQTSPSLILLDLMMPEMDGWEVCKQLRKTSDIPIIMLTARDDDVDKVVGLELGADDYVTKPFNPRELVARVKAVLRRTERGSEPTRVIRFQDLTIDLDRREFRIGERLVDLRPKEFDLLATLAASPGVVFDRERLLQVAWGYDYGGDSRTVDVHVTWLREKLSPQPGPHPDGLERRLQARNRRSASREGRRWPRQDPGLSIATPADGARDGAGGRSPGTSSRPTGCPVVTGGAAHAWAG